MRWFGKPSGWNRKRTDERRLLTSAAVLEFFRLFAGRGRAGLGGGLGLGLAAVLVGGRGFLSHGDGAAGGRAPGDGEIDEALFHVDGGHSQRDAHAELHDFSVG